MSSLSEKDIDVSKGMYVGEGINLKSGTQELEKIFIPWNQLNSHFMCLGTTRQGKTRLMVFMMRQIIEKKDHLILIDPKGAEGQEVVSWVVQYANKENSINDVYYWSPEHPDLSVKINLLYGQGDEEATSTIVGAMKVEDEFYEDIANEILMAVFPALSFIEEVEDKLFLEIMERLEYIKAIILNPINIKNKEMLGKSYVSSEHDVEDWLEEELIEQANGDEALIENIKIQYKKAKNYYIESDFIPIRRFVTFEDLAKFASPNSLKSLLEYVKTALTSAKNKFPTDVLKRGEKAINNLEMLAEEDAGFFSKVTKSYSVTMARLSTGNVGRLLCESRINILKDKFFIENERVILIAQPFPMKYEKAANMSIKMLMSMMNNLMSIVGVSGVANYKRIHVMIDEAGSIANYLMLSLANKGGGLGLSLYMYSQSFADYKDTLGEEGATILADNSNCKAFFLVNDDKSAETISAIMGSRKQGDNTVASSEGEGLRFQGKAVDEALVPPSLVMQLEPMTFMMKVGNQVYMMAAPFQRDPSLEIEFPHEDNRKKSTNYDNFIKNHIK